jgi:uncharacterized protein YkwD
MLLGILILSIRTSISNIAFSLLFSIFTFINIAPMLRNFLKLSFLICFGLSIMLFASFRTAGDSIYTDQQQAIRAYEQVNKVRKDPNYYSERYGVSLKSIPSAPALIWNDTLAIVAQNKALDMAMKDYFGSVDKDGYGINYLINKAGYKLDPELLKHDKADNFLAYDGGSPSGEEAIKAIIVGKGNDSKDGRELLLGVGTFNAGLTEIGVGFVHGTKETKYRTYTCVIISRKHYK